MPCADAFWLLIWWLRCCLGVWADLIYLVAGFVGMWWSLVFG